MSVNSMRFYTATDSSLLDARLTPSDCNALCQGACMRRGAQPRSRRQSLCGTGARGLVAEAGQGADRPKISQGIGRTVCSLPSSRNA
eukprot:15922089-Heterocapsa_arctica.AAC.1